MKIGLRDIDPNIARRIREMLDDMRTMGFQDHQHPHTPEHFLCLPKMNGALYSDALQDFAQEMGAGAHRRVVLVVDGAGPHRSGGVVVPEGLHLVTLPPYSPELQPAERLWPLTNEPLVNRHFAPLDELTAVQEARCRVLADMTEQVRGRTLFHWWPQLGK